MGLQKSCEAKRCAGKIEVDQKLKIVKHNIVIH
jgi:hypothetical protein